MATSMPTAHQHLMEGLVSTKGTEVTLFLSSGCELICKVTAVTAVSNGLVFVETDLSRGTLLASSVIGFTQP